MPRTCMMLVLAVLLAAAVPSSSVTAGPPPGEPPRALPGPDALVPVMDAHELAHRIAGSGQLLLVDTREAVEHAISRIKPAIRVQSVAEQDTLIGHVRRAARANQAVPAALTVVFYCTGGYRSQQLAEVLHYDLIEAGAASVHVLDGGIIAWANAGFELSNGLGPTRDVHPWNAEMARGLKDQDRVRYAPR